MADLQYVKGRTKSSENPILNGYRFVIDKKKEDNTEVCCGGASATNPTAAAPGS